MDILGRVLMYLLGQILSKEMPRGVRASSANSWDKPKFTSPPKIPPKYYLDTPFFGRTDDSGVLELLQTL